MRFLIGSLLALIASPLYAATTVQSKQVSIVQSVSPIKLVNDNFAIVGDQTYVQSGVIVTVQSDFKFFDLEARKSLTEFANPQKIDDVTWLITAPGTYLVEVVAFDPEKGIERARVTVTVPPGPNPPPDPDVPDVPDVPIPPQPADPLVRNIKGWSESVNDPLTAQGIASVYRQVREALECGRLNTASVWEALKPTTDGSIEIVGTNKNWNTFRQNLSDVIATATQQGKLTTPDEVGRLLYKIQQGLEFSADGTTALDTNRMKLIAKRTEETIDAYR